MNDRYLIECAKEADRDALAVILIRNGYTVRRHKAKVGTSKSWTYYIQYWKE